MAFVAPVKSMFDPLTQALVKGPELVVPQLALVKVPDVPLVFQKRSARAILTLAAVKAKASAESWTRRREFLSFLEREEWRRLECFMGRKMIKEREAGTVEKKTGTLDLVFISS